MIIIGIFRKIFWNLKEILKIFCNNIRRISEKFWSDIKELGGNWAILKERCGNYELISEKFWVDFDAVS